MVYPQSSEDRRSPRSWSRLCSSASPPGTSATLGSRFSETGRSSNRGRPLYPFWEERGIAQSFFLGTLEGAFWVVDPILLGAFIEVAGVRASFAASRSLLLCLDGTPSRGHSGFRGVEPGPGRNPPSGVEEQQQQEENAYLLLRVPRPKVRPKVPATAGGPIGCVGKRTRLPSWKGEQATPTGSRLGRVLPPFCGARPSLLRDLEFPRGWQFAATWCDPSRVPGWWPRA